MRIKINYSIGGMRQPIPEAYNNYVNTIKTTEPVTVNNIEYTISSTFSDILKKKFTNIMNHEALHVVYQGTNEFILQDLVLENLIQLIICIVGNQLKIGYIDGINVVPITNINPDKLRVGTDIGTLSYNTVIEFYKTMEGKQKKKFNLIN
jgi:hypothetical protein